MKKKKNNFKNQPDPVFSYTDGEGKIIRNVLSEYIQDYL